MIGKGPVGSSPFCKKASSTSGKKKGQDTGQKSLRIKRKGHFLFLSPVVLRERKQKISLELSDRDGSGHPKEREVSNAAGYPYTRPVRSSIEPRSQVMISRLW